MKHGVYSIFVMIGFFIACDTNNTQDQQAPETGLGQDSIITGRNDDAFSDEAIAFINETGFSRYAKSKAQQIDWTKFVITRFWKENFLIKTPFEPVKSYFDSYGQFLKFSPDSSKFIDLDSYNYAISKDKNGRLIGNVQGPDTRSEFS